MEELSTIRLETSRLYLIPLTLDQLSKYIKLDGLLEAELNLNPVQRIIHEELLLTLQGSIIPYICINPEQVLFGTLWIIIHKEKNVIVGDIAYKGGPSDKGLIEVGYATQPEFMNQGFMTEALQAFTKWAFEYPEILIILAETDKNNLASQKILLKSNFQAFAETELMYWWRLDRDPIEENTDSVNEN